jgi:3-oxoacyl-[acyl-carrier protein] reductase
VTVNVLIPGGASDTAMVPAASVPDRDSLIKPSVMIAPAVWLTSHASDGVTGMRFIGRDWNPAASDERNLATAGALAGWRTTS